MAEKGGPLKKPVKKVKVRRTPRKRDYAVRKPPDYEVKEPGDLVQYDGRASGTGLCLQVVHCGAVERLNRTFQEEFWVCYDGDLTLPEMRPSLKEWTMEVYNELRPHQSLGYVSPARYLEAFGIGRCVA